jgi:hypothetical protein
MKKTIIIKPRSMKLNAVVAETVSHSRHLHSETIHSEARILQVQAEEAERAIIALTAALNAMKDKLARIEAQQRGLASVIERR